MKTWLRSRHFGGLAYGLLLGLPSAACSESSPEPPGSGGDPDLVIGAFQVEMTADDEDPDRGSTLVIGKVSDAPRPPQIIWEVALEDGACRVETPRVPFCDGGCGADVCAEDGVCLPYPAGQNVGEVTLSGVLLVSGETQIVLREVNKNYQAPAATSFAFPSVVEGEDVKVHATGGEYPGFDLAAPGVAPLTLAPADFELDVDKALELSWPAPSDPSRSRIRLKLDISHHGGTRGMIQCEAEDSGSLTLSAELVSELIGLGVAGFPTLLLTRVSTDTAGIPQGRVELTVSSKVEQPVTVAGVVSCNSTSCEADDDGCIPCPDGSTCQADLTCR